MDSFSTNPEDGAGQPPVPAPQPEQAPVQPATPPTQTAGPQGAPTGTWYTNPAMTGGNLNPNQLPADIARRWNWGAFFLNWIWGIGNNTWIALLMFIPFVNWVMIFVLGAKGNEWAWQNRRWESVDQFVEVQRAWSRWGVGIFLVSCVLSVLIIVFAGVLGVIGSKIHDNASTTSTTSSSTTMYKVGDTIKVDGKTLKVNSVKKDYTPDNDFVTPSSSDNEFVAVNVTLTNTGTSEQDVSDVDFTLEDQTGTQRETTYSDIDNELSSVTLSKGGTTTGNMVFEAKTDSSKLILHYKPGYDGADAVEVTL